MIIKNFIEYIKERFGDYSPSPKQSPKITDYSQGEPNGMAGTSDPNMKTIDNDDPMVGYDRFLRDVNKNPVLREEKPIRKWRKKRNIKMSSKKK